MTQDRPFLGILLMLGFCIVAPVGDAIAKLLGGNVPLGQVLIARFGLQLLVLAPFVWLTARSLRMTSRTLNILILRTLMHIAGIGMMFTALIYLPLADAVAIAFVLPFIMLLLGHFFLQEEVGARRLAACLVGFLGTLLVVQPAFENVGWPALLPLGVAVNFALFMLLTRKIAKDIDAVTLQAVSGGIATVVLIPAVFLIPASLLPDANWISLPTAFWWKLMAIGVLGTVAHLLMTWSLRYAPSATLAPMQYLEIPFAGFIGWLIFNDVPNTMALIGICITVAAGLYIMLREQRVSRMQAKPKADDMLNPAE